MPLRAVHPPRNSKGKTTPIKNRPHSCVVDPFRKKKMMLPLVLILLMCQTAPWTNQNIIDLESEASQLLHQKNIDFNCNNGFQKGVPLRAVHPPRTSKGKTTPIKNRPHSCVRLIHFQKRKLMLPLVRILMMCQTPPRTNQTIIDFESQASQLLHQRSIDFNCKNAFQRGMPLRAVPPPRNIKRKTTLVESGTSLV